MANRSLLEQFRLLPAAVRKGLLDRHGEDALLAALGGEGGLRPAQMAPHGGWSIWMILAGRGFGKTHAGTEWVHAKAAGGRQRIALVAPTLDLARAVMVEGESGLLARAPADLDVRWHPSTKRVLWSNGSEARLFSGGEPDSLRGGQFHCAWGDEFAHWPGGEDALMNLRMATRLGSRPQILLTTTPLPMRWLKALMAEPGVVVTRGGTQDNAANLPAAYLAGLEQRFGGTATGRQEMQGEIVEDLEGALWTRAQLEACRLAAAPPATRVVVGVDPPAAGGTCGIVVAATADDQNEVVSPVWTVWRRS